jgi:hypothetical protein
MAVTVRELIEQLENCDSGAEVWIKETGEDDIFIEADGVGNEQAGKKHVVTIEFHYGVSFGK